MWVIDIEKIMGIPSKDSRELFAQLIQGMDIQAQKSMITAEMRNGLCKQRLSKALIDLCHRGMIKRGDSSRYWFSVWVNPAVVRPWWLKGDLYTQRLDAYEQGPTGLGKKLMDEQA